MFCDPTPDLMEARRPLLLEAVARFNAGIRLVPPPPQPLFISVPKKIARVQERHQASRSMAKGNIPPGTRVFVGKHWGIVQCFLPLGADPEKVIVPGTPVTKMGGHRRHGPARNDRYYVILDTEKGEIHSFPKAYTVERMFWR